MYIQKHTFPTDNQQFPVYAMTRYSYNLCCALKMQNNEDLYEKIKTQIREISLKHLDVRQTFGLQPKALEAMTKEFKETWPDLFSDEDEESGVALRLAVYYVRRNHEYARCRAKAVDSVPSTAGPRRNPVRQSASTSNRVTHISARQDGPMPLPCPQTTGVKAIRQFLETCLPPMDHYLARFLEAGLRTEECLFAASTWGADLMENFLDQLPPDASGSHMLLMEKMVLLHQFETYFQ